MTITFSFILDVARSHLSEALLAREDVVELGQRVEQVVRDLLPGKLFLHRQVIVNLKVLEGVVTDEVALVFHAVEDLTYCYLAQEGLGHRGQ